MINKGANDPQIFVLTKDELVGDNTVVDGTGELTFSTNVVSSMLKFSLVPPRETLSPAEGPKFEGTEDFQVVVPVTGLDLTAPSGIVEGELLMMLMTAEDVLTVTQPGGWTVFASEAINDDQSYIAYKIAGSSEPAVYNFAGSIETQWTGSIMRFSNIDQSSPINVSASKLVDIGTSNHDIAGNSVTPTKDGVKLLHFFACDADRSSTHSITLSNYNSQILVEEDSSYFDDYGMAAYFSLHSHPAGVATPVVNHVSSVTEGINCRLNTLGLAPP